MEYTQSISSKGAKCSVDIAEPKGLCSSRSVHLMVNETVLYVLGVPTWSVSQCEAAMHGRGGWVWLQSPCQRVALLFCQHQYSHSVGAGGGGGGGEKLLGITMAHPAGTSV